MAVVEGIRGIRSLPVGVTPDRPIARSESRRPIHISRLQEADIPEFMELLHRGLDATPSEFLPAEDKTNHKKMRTATYYQEALKRPDYHTIFVARNDDGRIIGGLETSRFTVDGCPIGFVNWVNVDPEIRKGNVALELYRQYEEYSQKEGFIFLMANVHTSNKPSRALHRKAGFRDTPYLQKPSELNSHWYAKQINPLPEGVEISITETDFLPQNVIDALPIIQLVMRDEDLGEIDITYHDEEINGKKLINVAAPDDVKRQRFLQILFMAGDIIDQERGHDATQADIERSALKTAHLIRQ